MKNYDNTVSPTNEDAIAPLKPVTVKIDGKYFYCHCEWKIFHHPKNEPNIYKCNACGEL